VPSTERLIACSNFQGCSFAGIPKWRAGLGACPNCGKVLESPYLVTVERAGLPGVPTREGQAFRLLISVSLPRSSLLPAQLFLKQDGDGIQKKSIKGFKENNFSETFNVNGLPRGSYIFQVKLVTSDGWETWSNADTILVASPQPDRFALWLCTVLLIVLLCASTTLAWMSDGALRLGSGVLSLVLLVMTAAIFAHMVGGRQFAETPTEPPSRSELNSSRADDRVTRLEPPSPDGLG
jgi:hypothetical protein